ncbi:MAG: DUF4412 domain-containing protein [Bacteroidetes bacterium]|nr:DUF4412 domain-containing protein [Bacteroidota bacterium]
MTSKILTILAFVVVFGTAVGAAQFDADIRMVQQGNAMEGKFFARDLVYRIDMNHGGPGIYVIVDQKVDSALVVNTAARQYMRLPVTNPQIIKTDLIQTARMIESLGVIKNYQGEETLHGLVCDRYYYLRNNEPRLEVWISRDLAYPIRIQNGVDTSSYMELVNVLERPQDDSLFVVPAGFSERERPKPPVSPDAPAPRIIKEGTKLRLPIDPKRVAVVRLINTAVGESACLLTFFSGGSPVDPARGGGPETRSISLAAQGDKVERSFDLAADEVLVEVSKGAVAVDIDQ